MKRVEGFYKKILNYHQNEYWCFKFLQYMGEFFFYGIMLLTIAVNELELFWRLICPIGVFMGWSIYSKLAPFVWIKDEGKSYKLMDKLRYIPISKQQFFKIRWQVLWQYVRRLTLVNLLLSTLMTLIFLHRITVLNLLPLAMGGYGLVIGYCIIKE